MKKVIILMILGLVLIGVSVQAATLRWEASTGDVVGYNVHFTDGDETYEANVGNVTEVVNIDDVFQLHLETTYIFTVRAYNDVGESGDSNSASYTTPDAYDPSREWNIPVKKEKPSVIINLILED